MRFVCKYCNEGVSGKVIVYGNEPDEWVLVEKGASKTIKRWKARLNGEVFTVKEGNVVK